MNLYLVKRPPKAVHPQASHHPVIICTNKELAEWEAGYSGERAWMWVQFDGQHSGWLQLRWEGLVIDYGHVVRSVALPDGTTGAFHHRSAHPETWALLKGAVWFSSRRMPAWLAAEGAILAPDDFARRAIAEGERFIRTLHNRF